MKQGYTWQKQRGIDPVIVAAWYRHGPAPLNYRLINHPAWVMDFSFTGGTRYRVAPSRRLLTRQPKSIHLYPPGMRLYADQSPIAHGVIHSVFIVFMSQSGFILNNLPPDASGFWRFDDGDELAAKLMVQAAQSGHTRQATGFCQAQSLLWRIFELLQASQPVRDGPYKIVPLPRGDTRSAFVQAVDGILRQKITGRTSLPAIARLMHVSPSSLSHRYHRETGGTPMAQLTRLRINYAKGMLLRGEPLKTIADAAGFSDAFHFSKVFKQTTGFSPRDFRAHHGATPGFS